MWTVWICLAAIFVVLRGDSPTVPHIECGKSAMGIVSKGQIISLQFTIDQQQDIQLMDVNHSFAAILNIKDSENRYIDNTFTKTCDQKKCEGMVFTVKSVSRGTYTVGMIPEGNGGYFKLDMLCPIGGNEGVGLSAGM